MITQEAINELATELAIEETLRHGYFLFHTGFKELNEAEKINIMMGKVTSGNPETAKKIVTLVDHFDGMFSHYHHSLTRVLDGHTRRNGQTSGSPGLKRNAEASPGADEPIQI